ncbi:hypothetical protein QYE76_060544 [Lolium multiflorum]|uniref:F-box domain-containing protein n=1 Tax=Lolium multiflorum TaxID=4521 RepID=A0AAD8W6D3_LOLMU|nr:hypothetical protein QYE76_060544 [Lolium multiflorum]
MANQQDDGASPLLPHDVVTEIFAYLPAKSVGRFRCVSRSWDATLSSALFVRLHLRQANNGDKPRFFFSPTFEPESTSKYQFYAWQPAGTPAVRKLAPNNFSRPAPLTKPLHGIVLIRCVNDGGYFLCNPSTGEVHPLPDSRAPFKMNPGCNPIDLPFYLQVAYGFGYCSANHRYKAVRIFSQEHKGAAPSCEVFVLNGDTAAYWRPAASQPPMCVVEEENPAVFMHGRLHFLCRDDGVILTFNVGDETFATLLQPPCPPGKAPLKMTELDGCLCVFRSDKDGPCHVWLLRDYAARRWEQLCCIDPTAWPEPERTQLRSDWIAPLGMCSCSGGNGSHKKIMLGTGTCKVFTVDLSGEGVPEILLKADELIAGDFDDTLNYPAIGLFEESLVTLGNTIEDMVFSSPVTKAWSDVLKWLPARSVSQLSLVCREWRAMVTTERFVRSHAAVHATRPRIKLVSGPLLSQFTDLEDHINNPHWRCAVPFDNPGMLQYSQPCHGLNLVSYNGHAVLCNPTTGHHESVYIEEIEREDTSFAGRIALGYESDSDSDDHVLVSLSYEEKNMETRDYKLECYLRYLREGWFPADPPPRPVAMDVPPVYADGKIYWVVEPKLGPCSAVCELVAFDIWDREFEVLQGPPSPGSGGFVLPV